MFKPKDLFLYILDIYGQLWNIIILYCLLLIRDMLETANFKFSKIICYYAVSL